MLKFVEIYIENMLKYKNNFLFPKIKCMSAKGKPGGIPVGRRKML